MGLRMPLKGGIILAELTQRAKSGYVEAVAIVQCKSAHEYGIMIGSMCKFWRRQ
jgi:hypothetical protein